MADVINLGTFSTSGDAIPNEQQFLRRSQLILGDQNGDAIDLSGMHIKFSITSATKQTLKHMDLRIYNLSKATTKRILAFKEFSQVIFNVGYHGGTLRRLFFGGITQIREGRENATDKFLDISAADGDFLYSYAVIAFSSDAHVGPGPDDAQSMLIILWTWLQKYGLKISDDTFNRFGIKSTGGKITQAAIGTGPRLPRGISHHGLVRDLLRSFAKSVNCDWFIENGELNIIPRGEALTGDKIILTPKTGLIGSAVQSEDGVSFRCLLNPLVSLKRVIDIQPDLITTTRILKPLPPSDYIPDLDTKGEYIVYALKSVGDSRGQAWYTEGLAEPYNKTNTTVGSNTRINAAQ